MNSITEGVSTERVLVEMEPHWFPSLYRTPYLTTTPQRTYVVVNEPAQVSHDHRPSFADKFGDGVCECGARLWSPWWVADGVYGHGTGEWIRTYETRLIHRSMRRIEVSS